MVWTKICGIRDVDTARSVVALRPSAIGLNFFPGSVRCLTSEVAQQISRIAEGSVERVALFVNATPEKIIETREVVQFDSVQLHGDEPPEALVALREQSPGLKLIRAFRIDSSGLSGVSHYLARCQELEVPLAACLIDAFVPGQFGGTGQLAPWDLLATKYDRQNWPPLIVAGGLNPENIGDAVLRVQPWGVDVASGVESEPGIKDLRLVEQFLSAAQS